MSDHFDEKDLELLRNIKRTPRGDDGIVRHEEGREHDGRRLRAASPAAGPRAHQLNVRVSLETKQMANELARHHHNTITDVVEIAIRTLYANTIEPSP